MESRSDPHFASPAATSSRLSAPCLLFLWLLLPAWAGAQEPPCASGVGVGFSTTPIESTVPFDSLLGVEGEDEIVFEYPAGATSGSVPIYVNIGSALEGPDEIMGYSVGVAFDGDLDLLHFLRRFPVLPPGFSCPAIISGDTCCSPPYPNIVDPAENQGQRGIVDVTSLMIGCGGPEPSMPPPSPFPPTGTQWLFGIVMGWSGGPLPAEGLTATLRFQGGLIGTRRPVPISNVITVGGETADTCNFDVASITVRFVKADVPQFVRGNANGDLKVDIADAIWMLNDLFLGGPTTSCKDAADANGDGTLSISDPIFLFDFQFLGGAPPPTPYPGCGVAPPGDLDPLGCDEASGCP